MRNENDNTLHQKSYEVTVSAKQIINVNAEELHQLARGGKLNLEMPCRLCGTEKWETLADFTNELMQSGINIPSIAEQKKIRTAITNSVFVFGVFIFYVLMLIIDMSLQAAGMLNYNDRFVSRGIYLPLSIFIRLCICLVIIGAMIYLVCRHRTIRTIPAKHRAFLWIGILGTIAIWLFASGLKLWFDPYN